MSIIFKYFTQDMDELEDRFIRAALSGDIKTAEAILEMRPSVVNHQDEETGLTGLMIFAADGVYSMVERISAVPEVKFWLEDAHGRSAELMAIVVGRRDIADLIAEQQISRMETLEPQNAMRQSEFDRNESNVVRFPIKSNPNDPSP